MQHGTGSSAERMLQGVIAWPQVRRAPMKTSKKSPKKSEKIGACGVPWDPSPPCMDTPSGVWGPRAGRPRAPPPAPDTATRQEPTQRAGRDLVTPLAARALHHWSWGVWLYLGNGNCYSTHETHSFRAERDAWSTSFHARHAVGLSCDIECDTKVCLLI